MSEKCMENLKDSKQTNSRKFKFPRYGRTAFNLNFLRMERNAFNLKFRGQRNGRGGGAQGPILWVS
jgi:hypothetical protein